MVPAGPPGALPSVAAVSYLNTVPLVWGLQQEAANRLRLEFCVPSECARRVESGRADLGIVPVIEIRRLGLAVVPGTGIACHGAVRSILLISRVEPRAIRSLAADSGSRTSVMLARLLLEHRYGCRPAIHEQDPHLDAMLGRADAALLIGDAALAVEPASLPYRVLDLGQEWLELTGLPMVFALWAGLPGRVSRWPLPWLERAFRDSLEKGMASMDAIVARESAARSFDPALVRRYLTRHIVFDIGPREREGMDTYLRMAAQLDPDLLPSLSTASS